MNTIYKKRNLIVFICAVLVVISSLFLFQSVFAVYISNLPIFGDSFLYKQWTPSSGSTNYLMIDEPVCNGKTDYNYTNTVGKRDLYKVDISGIPNNATINSIILTPCASRNKTGGGSAVMNLFYRYDGSISADAGNYVLPSGTTPVSLASTTFNGLSFVKNASSTLEIGAVLSSGNRGVRLSRISAIIDYTLPVSPVNLTSQNVSPNQNDLTWTDGSSIDGWVMIEGSLNDPMGPFYPIATTSTDVNTFSNMDLVPDQTYFYRVHAFDATTTQPYSNTSYAITSTDVPSAPFDLTAELSRSRYNIVLLNWSQNSNNEESFGVSRSVDGVNFIPVSQLPMNVTNTQDGRLLPGTYHYRVSARNNVGESDYSNVVTVVIPAY